MKIRVNKKIIRSLEPCRDSFAKGVHDYPHFDGDIVEFLSLEKITPIDKIWVAVKLIPRETLEYFAIDCVFAAVAVAADAYAADAADAYAADAAAVAADAYAAVADAYAAADAAYAAYAANAAADAAYAAVAYDAADAADAAYSREKERERQIDCLIYLIETSEDE